MIEWNMLLTVISNILYIINNNDVFCTTTIGYFKESSILLGHHILIVNKTIKINTCLKIKWSVSDMQ